jgi:alpha-L-fucosidase
MIMKPKRTMLSVLIFVTSLAMTLPLKADPDQVVEAFGNSFNQENGEAAAVEHEADAKAWFYDAGLGLFLHWGIYSLMEQEPSWCMLKSHMNRGGPFFHPEKYYAMAEKFDPQHYNPGEWLEAAKQAGFTYAVLTTKHHDGYALWPSEHGEMNSGIFLDGRDLVKPFVEACRANGLRVGLYFSGVDWYHEDFPRHADRITQPGLDYTYEDIDYSQWRRWDKEEETDPATVEKRLNQFYDYAQAQLRELLTNYGKIDLLWFDGFPVEWFTEELPALRREFHGKSRERIAGIHKMIVELQPDIVINNRAAGMPADFQTPERGDGTFLPGDSWILKSEQWRRKWELCNLWSRGGGWGYSADGVPKGRDRNSAEWVLRRLAQCRAKGGNMLTNSAPTPNGKQPASFYRGCEELAAWMEHSRVSVIGAGALDDDWEKYSDDDWGPCLVQSVEFTAVPVTTGKDVWYLHIFPNNKSENIVLRNLPFDADKVILLRTGQALDFQKTDDGLNIVVPADVRTTLNDVVVVYWK